MNPEALRQEAGSILARYETEPEHTRHVALLSLQLFDALADWHGLAGDDRVLLEVAAWLHDIGWAITQPDGIGHHKESGRLIREHRWETLEPDSVEVVAQVARYHRKGLPDLLEHRSFALLSEAGQRRVQFLSAFLRVGDGLDRRHVQRVRRVQAGFTPGGLLIEAEAVSDVDIVTEMEAADRKADLLRRLTPGVQVREMPR